MNMPMDDDMKVGFTTTLFALIRENLDIKMRPGKCGFSGECHFCVFNCSNFFQPMKWTLRTMSFERRSV